jgi:hypothetical protein
MKSELFSNSYCIFIQRNDSNYYKNELVKENLLDEGVRVLNANFDPDLSCVVIPIKSDYRRIVDILWQKRVDNGGFWHQYGIGYGGKEWELC